MSSEVFIAMSENKFNENNVVANDPNCLASVVTQEIHTDNKAGVYACVNNCHSATLHFINTDWSLCAKPQNLAGSYLLIHRAVKHSLLRYYNFVLVSY